MELFGLRLRALRLEKKMTQEQIGDKIGVGHATISGYEVGASFPTVEGLKKLCEYLDVSSDYLLGLSANKDIEFSYLTDDQVIIILGLIAQFDRLNTLSGEYKK